MALSLGMVSCDDYTEPNPPAQSNPQLEIFKATDIKISKVAATTLDLQTAAAGNADVVVANLDELAYFPENYDLQFMVEVATDQNFSKFTAVPAGYHYGEGVNDIYVNPNQLNDSISVNFTKDPADIATYMRVAAYAVQGTNYVRLGDKATNYYYSGAEPWAFTIDRVDPVRPIAAEYVLVGSFCNWDIAQGLPVVNTDLSVSPYDNPSFQVVFDITDEQAAAGFQWKIVAKGATNLDNSFGPADPALASGVMLEAAGQDNAGVITTQGRYMIKVNMETLAYEQGLAIERLYVPGQGSSTSNFSRVLQLATDNYVNYTGVARLRNNWYLTAQPSNTGLQFRSAGNETTDDKTGVVSGGLIADNSAEMMKADNGLYYLDVNVVKLTYTASPLNQISAIGAYNEWNTETAVDLTPSSNFLTWTVKDLDLPAGEFKFCCNHAWTLSFGGALDNLVQNGGNINVTEAGTYDITIDFSKIPYTCTMTKK